MRLFIFKSESGALSAFAGDSDARVLPTQHGPWHPIGVVRPDGMIEPRDLTEYG